jgi:hypothetical protein
MSSMMRSRGECDDEAAQAPYVSRKNKVATIDNIYILFCHRSEEASDISSNLAVESGDETL